jgi:hypothetical protein
MASLGVIQRVGVIGVLQRVGGIPFLTARERKIIYIWGNGMHFRAKKVSKYSKKLPKTAFCGRFKLFCSTYRNVFLILLFFADFE